MNKIVYSFSDFNPEEKALLVSVPFRVGVWLSHCDPDGGDISALKESIALEHLLNVIAGNFCESAFVMELMEKTLSARNQWPSWENDAKTVLQDVTRSIEILEHRIRSGDLASYKASLMEIALAVAMAYNEALENKPLVDKLNACARLWFENTIGQMKGKRTSGEFGLHMNISEIEERALKELADALHIDAGEVSDKFH